MDFRCDFPMYYSHSEIDSLRLKGSAGHRAKAKGQMILDSRSAARAMQNTPKHCQMEMQRADAPAAAEVRLVQTQLARALRLSSIDEESGEEDWAQCFARLCRHQPHRRHLDASDFVAAVRREGARHPSTPLGCVTDSVLDALWEGTSSLSPRAAVGGERRIGLADFIGLLSDVSAEEPARRPAEPSPAASRQCW